MKPKILLVDDNEFIIDIMTLILVSNGYEVTVLNTGSKVIDTVKHDHPDLVILDAELPDADGREICHDLKTDEATKDMPVIMCSAREDIKETFFQEGPPDDILPKPFDISLLIERVKRQIRNAA